jgi:hypothetical protein
MPQIARRGPTTAITSLDKETAGGEMPPHYLHRVLLGAAKDNDVDMLETLLDDGVEVRYFLQKKTKKVEDVT